jgi:hypothetical protein
VIANGNEHFDIRGTTGVHSSAYSPILPQRKGVARRLWAGFLPRPRSVGSPGSKAGGKLDRRPLRLFLAASLKKAVRRAS